MKILRSIRTTREPNISFPLLYFITFNKNTYIMHCIAIFFIKSNKTLSIVKVHMFGVIFKDCCSCPGSRKVSNMQKSIKCEIVGDGAVGKVRTSVLGSRG